MTLPVLSCSLLGEEDGVRNDIADGRKRRNDAHNHAGEDCLIPSICSSQVETCNQGNHGAPEQNIETHSDSHQSPLAA